MEGISKTFPGVKALDQVDLEIHRGEVLALVGENGAGKSTLMKILGGIHSRDSGTIVFEGRPADLRDPAHARRLGISIIHQELNVMENLSVAENIFVGDEIRTALVFVDRKAQAGRTRELLSSVGLDVDPRALMKDLSLASRQMVEIAKSLSMNAKLIIMDEPTSSLTERETERLFRIVREVCARGIGVIYISHRLEEIFELADRVTVLRDGRTVGTKELSECTKETLIAMMVGREIDELYPKTEGRIGNEALRVEKVSTVSLLREVSFSVREGEVLGFAGLVGAGRTELAKVVFGLDRKSGGDIYLAGKKVSIPSPWEAIRLGIGYVPEDRKREGLVLGMAVRGNISLSVLERLRRYLFVSGRKEKELAEDSILRLRIKAQSASQAVKFLSGGNQQKVVLAKGLATTPKVLILDEPTRGVDVGAKKEIHSIIDALAKTGMAIIVISSELPEILGISDRIVVMRNGRIRGELRREEATQVKVLELAFR
jgi:ABC-type sugar transport system ATPase subunit